MADSSSSQSSSSGEEDQEDVMDMRDCSLPVSALLETLTKLKDEELVVKSSKAQQISSFVDVFLENGGTEEVIAFSEFIVEQFLSFLKVEGGKVAASKLWRSYHLMRVSSTTRMRWESCTATFGLSQEVLAVSDIVLQMVLRRMMQTIIQQSTTLPKCLPAPLTLTVRECNIIQYIAGYVVLRMKKKFPLFESFFESIITTTCNYFSASAVEEYTRVWVEQVNRGGLYRVQGNFFSLLKEIETICRQHLDIRQEPSDKLFSTISSSALTSPAVTGLWHEISVSYITPADSQTLLQAIIMLWTNIRVHSFTRNWADQLRGETVAAISREKALRKALEQRGTAKDTTNT